MYAIRHGEAPVVVGVDAGATWVRVLVLGGARPIAQRVIPACEVDELGKLLRKVWKATGLGRRSPAALVVATRGIWTASERSRLAARLSGLARRVVVFSDAQVALLGAIGETPGLLVLAGTGSIAVGRDGRGRWQRAGGMGPLLGDEGSGFWLGRQWLRATTAGEDMLPTRRLVKASDPVARIAALAPFVIRRARRGDRRAGAIVRSGQAHLAELALEVARRLRLARPVTISWAGSVLGDRWFRAGVQRAVARAGLRARWVRPALPPVEAAAHLAQALAARPRAKPRA